MIANSANPNAVRRGQITLILILFVTISKMLFANHKYVLLTLHCTLQEQQ